MKSLFVLLVIIIAVLLYSEHEQKTAGQDWCDEMITSFENDKLNFNKEFSQNTKDGVMFFPPKAKSKNTNAVFTLHANGDYICKYWHGGASRPHSYAYDSTTKVWRMLD